MTTSDREGDAGASRLDAAPVGGAGPMTDASHRLDALRGVALVALAASVLLLIEWSLAGPRLCGFASDCDRVTRSRFGSPLGIPLPALGVLAFGAVFGLSLAPGTRAGRLLRPLSIATALAGVFLIGVQIFVLRHLCPYCLLVDVLAVAGGCLVVTDRRSGVTPAISTKARTLWISAAAVLTLGTSLGVLAGGEGIGEKVPVPPRVAASWVPGRVTLVEIYDFQCPYCRRLEPVLTAFLAEEGDRIHHVRLTVPMPAHRHARPASRAFLCAGRQGEGDAMAKRLIVSPLLTPEACEHVASSLGLALPEYRSCVSDRATDGALDADLAWVKDAHPAGLPVIWVQDRPLSGLRPDRARDTLRAAVRAARERLKLPTD